MTSSDKANAAFPKRFYDLVSVDKEAQGYRVFLDGRPISTPLKQPLALPSRALAEAVAAEWEAQEERVVPSSMPLSKLAYTCIDHAHPKRDAILDDFAAYCGSDMLCYRADAPSGLVERQEALWGPVLNWAASDLDARLNVTVGVTHCEQPASVIDALRGRADAYDIFRLTGLHVLTALTGSGVLALALIENAVAVEDGWQAAYLDEEWQAEKWGRDAEAERQRALRKRDYEAALKFVSLLPS